MTEETAGAETLAAADDAAPVENSEATTEQQQDAESSEVSAEPDTTSDEAETPPGDDAADKPPVGVQNRINELTRKRHEAERRAERAEQKLRQRQEAGSKDDLDFEDEVAERAVALSQKDQIENDREAARELAAEAFRERVSAVSAKYTDFEAVAYGGHWNPTAVMQEVILDSDLGPDLAYHLGSNPGEAARIASMNPVRQATELGLIQAKLSAPKPPPKIPAAPVKPVGGQAKSDVKDPAKMSMSEYIAARKAGKV